MLTRIVVTTMLMLTTHTIKTVVTTRVKSMAVITKTNTIMTNITIKVLRLLVSNPIMVKAVIHPRGNIAVTLRKIQKPSVISL